MIERLTIDVFITLPHTKAFFGLRLSVYSICRWQVHSRPQCCPEKTPSPSELIKELLTGPLQARARDAHDLKAGGEYPPPPASLSSAPSVNDNAAVTRAHA